jgi:hypothetical protein
MWRVDSQSVGYGTLRWTISADGRSVLSFESVLRAWRLDSSFRGFWTASLRGVPSDAYCWECPPVCDANESQPFECVFVASPSLARMRPDRGAFAEHFRRDSRIVTFRNLGGDATLVAPCPDSTQRDYAHLAQFVRAAPKAQQDALWQAVGEAMLAGTGARPTWLSTAGHGVAWLHVRLDSSPKYYRHAAYRCA